MAALENVLQGRQAAAVAIRRFQELAIGGLLAAAMTLFLNAPLFWNLMTGTESKHPDITEESSDESFYLSRIREVMDGHWMVGNPSIFELRDQAYPVGILSEWAIGGIGRLLHLEIKTVSILADLLLPFFAMLLLWWAVLPILQDKRWRALLLMTVFLCGMMTFWKRPISPQGNSIFFFAWLGLFLRQKHHVGRGLLTGLMLFSYPFHWTLALATEGVTWILESVKQRRIAWRRIALFTIAFAPFFLLYIALTIGTSDPQAYQETLVRLGKIPTHFPTGPKHQVVLLLLLLGSAAVWYRKRHALPLSLMALLSAGLAVFNQPLLLGWDAEFATHYGKILQPVIWLTLFWVAIRIIPMRWQTTILVIAFTITGLRTAQEAHTEWQLFPKRALSEEQRQADAQIFDALNALEGEHVILTDDRLGRLLTIYTPHYPFFTSETQLSPASNTELLARAEVQRMATPNEATSNPRALFGSAHLNAALNMRLRCQLFSAQTSCDIEAESLLPPEWHAFKAGNSLSPEEAIKRLHDRHVTHALLKDTPSWLKTSLENPMPIGDYTLWTLKP